VEKDGNVLVGSLHRRIKEQLASIAIAVHLKKGIAKFNDVKVVVHTETYLTTKFLHKGTDGIENLVADDAEGLAKIIGSVHILFFFIGYTMVFAKCVPKMTRR
jgi:hypothetical protein